MNNVQRSYLLIKLHGSSPNEIESVLNRDLKTFGANLNEIEMHKKEVLEMYHSGIKHLNSNQFKNLLNEVSSSNFDKLKVQNKLDFYEIDKSYHKHILSFFEDYKLSLKSIPVEKLDRTFKGVQVATRDDFNMILNNGYTGDWVLSPESIHPKRVQVASMNETGSYPRGYFINADIVKIEKVYYGVQLRYRLHFINPVIVNTGNRNIKFKMNPVSYIK